MYVFYGACVSRRLPFCLPLSPVLHAPVLSVRVVLEDDGWSLGTLLRGVPGGIPGGFQGGFQGGSKGFEGFPG